jgi:hypothetical protein
VAAWLGGVGQQRGEAEQLAPFGCMSGFRLAGGSSGPVSCGSGGACLEVKCD